MRLEEINPTIRDLPWRTFANDDFKEAATKSELS